MLAPPLDPSRTEAGRVVRKLPALTAAFWAMKICATTLGETAGDLLSMTLDVGYAAATAILLGFFAATVLLQLGSRRYHPPVYWAVIVSTSTAGTTASDFMDRTLGLGYAAGTALLATLLALVLGVWRATEGSLSVDRVTTRRGEAFYWCAILVSNTLGTALGDYLADDSGLGFAGGALVVGSALAVVLAASRWTRASRVASFWIAFVLTRPFGATMGDVLTKPRERHGLDLGTAGSSAVLLAVIVALVVREAVIERGRRVAGAA